MNVKTLVTAAGVAALLAAFPVSAAEIKVLASNGVKATLDELAPAFERQTGNRLVIEYGLAAVLKRQIEGGAQYDVAILTSAGVEDLVKQGKMSGGSRAAIARSSVGIGIRKGGARPDIGTPEAFKRALLAAKSVTWAKEGQSGIYFAGLIERIGVAEQVKPKAVIAATGTEVGGLVASGKVELGVSQLNELMAVPGVEVLGPLPGELQSYTAFHAGVASGAKNAQGATALIKFLTTPAAGAVFKAKGQEPG